MYKSIPNIIKENAKIVHRNFAGRVDQYNKDGKRTFSLVIENPDDAEKLIEEGWYVKRFKPRDDQDEPGYFLPVTVSYKAYPPKIYLVSKGNVRLLREDEVGNIDDYEIENVDITIRPYCWEASGKEGVRAYLKTMYVTLVEDDFAYKYQKDISDPAPDVNEEVPWNG